MNKTTAVLQSKAMIKRAYADTTDQRSKALLKRAYNLLEEAVSVTDKTKDAKTHMRRANNAGHYDAAYNCQRELIQCRNQIRNLKRRLYELEADARMYYGW